MKRKLFLIMKRYIYYQAAGGIKPRTSVVCCVVQSGGFHVTFHPGIGSHTSGWYVSCLGRDSDTTSGPSRTVNSFSISDRALTAALERSLSTTVHS